MSGDDVLQPNDSEAVVGPTTEGRKPASAAPHGTRPQYAQVVLGCEMESHYAVKLACGHVVERSKPKKLGKREHCGVCAYNAGESYK